MKKLTSTLILCQDAERAAQCQRALSHGDMQVWSSPSELPEDGNLDLIISDGLVDCAPWAPPKIAARLATGEIGLVRLSGEGAADVCLPADVTHRELRLTCSLVAQIVRLRRDCNRGRRLQQALQHLAYTDPLTVLPNRRAWDEELLAHVNGERPTAAVVCLAILDLDHFKEINDRGGHALGDEVLRQVAAHLATVSPSGGFAARLGGDEFGLLLSNASVAELWQVVETVRVVACSDSPVASLTASAGYAVAAEALPFDPAALFEAASDALRQAKTAGRNRTWPICVIQP